VKTNHERPKQQAINLRALRWALEQEGMSTAEKAVLVSFAYHANERGYSWPSVDDIASTWQLHRTTVLRQIKALLVRHKLRATRKRVGMTRQGKVYRMPKSTYERVAQSHPLQKPEESQKGSKRVAQCDPNKEQGRKVRTASCVNGEHNSESENKIREGTTHNMQTTSKKEEVFEGKDLKEPGSEPAQRDYMIHGRVVSSDIANRMFAKDNTLEFTPV
jgi:pyocin large subunit-like protein